MRKVIAFGNKLEEGLLTICMGIIAVVVIAQVVCRLIGSSLPWSEELTRYLTIWVTFVGASYGFRTGAHIGMDAFKGIFPARGRAFIELVSAIICIVISLLCVGFGISMVGTQMHYGQVTPAMRIPMWIPYAAIPFGFSLCVLRNLALAWEYFLIMIGKDSKKDEVEQV